MTLSPLIRSQGHDAKVAKVAKVAPFCVPPLRSHPRDCINVNPRSCATGGPFMQKVGATFATFATFGQCDWDDVTQAPDPTGPPPDQMGTRTPYSGPTPVGPSISLFNLLKRKALYPNHLSLHYPRLINGGCPLYPCPPSPESLIQSSSLRVQSASHLFPGVGLRAGDPDTQEDSQKSRSSNIPVFHTQDLNPVLN